MWVIASSPISRGPALNYALLALRRMVEAARRIKAERFLAYVPSLFSTCGLR